MTPEQQKVINELRDAGYVIVLWAPEELGENFSAADEEHLEDLVISRGNEIIEDCKRENGDT